MASTTESGHAEDERDGSTRFWLAIVAAFLLVVGLWLGTRTILPMVLGVVTPAPSVADLYEIINALFSGLAFVGVVAAILLQRRELSLQRQELRETRNELRGQKEALVTQNSLLTASNTQQVLVPLLLEYRSRPMFKAIGALKALHHRDPDRVDENYLALDDEDPLRYQRRMVSHFYGLLAGLYSQGVVPPDLLFSYWSGPDLQIIPDIVVPIERAMRKKSGVSLAATTRWEEMLLKLHRDGTGDHKPEEAGA
jgi:hypothetical protein